MPARKPAPAPPPADAHARRVSIRYLTLLIILVSAYVARTFLVPIAWAAVLAITLWPLYCRHSSKASRAWRSPLLFTAGTGLVLMLPLSLLALEVAQDSQTGLAWIQQAQQHGIAAPTWLAHLPLLGTRLAAWWQLNLATPQGANQLLGSIDGNEVLKITGFISAQVAHGSLLFLVTLIALFAFLRHGTWLAAEAALIGRRYIGEFGDRLVEHLVQAIRGTVAGTVMVAIGEGTLIGFGYVLAGVPRPFLFGMLTIAFAMLPFGAWFMFAIATILLLVQGSILAAIVLFMAASAVMLIGDNFVQPALIGNSIRLPFLLALVGTFGGLETLGLVGLFLGPVLMASLLLLWHESVDRQLGHSTPQA